MLWLNTSGDPADRDAMAAALDSILVDADVEVAAHAALFLGSAGKAWTGADDRLVRALERERRAPVLAAMIATQVIIDDAMEGDSTMPPPIAARRALAEDPVRRDAVIAHLETRVDQDAGGEVLAAMQYLRSGRSGGHQ